MNKQGLNESRRYVPPDNPGDALRRVLVIKLGALGDFMQALGAMRVVRAAHPSAQITLLTTPLFKAFAEACPYFDIVEADGRPRDAKGKAALIRRLRNAGYDMVYDFQNNDRTAQYFAGMTGKRPLWSGAAPTGSHPHRNPDRGAMHNFDRLEEQLRHAGLSPNPASGWIEGQPPFPYLDWVRPALGDAANLQPAFFGLADRYALLVPGSSPKEPEKRWPKERFAALAGWFADHGVTPAILGASTEQEIGADIARLEPRAVNLVGKTDLFQLAALSERAVALVGGDTGPTHLAAAAGAPIVCLFAQVWTPAMEQALGTIWNPKTRLGHAAPSGRSPTIILQAARLDMLSLEDVQAACAALMTAPRSVDGVDAWLTRQAGMVRRSGLTFAVLRQTPDVAKAGFLDGLKKLVRPRRGP